jgi:LytS/YehU family sensor histidine kinase
MIVAAGLAACLGTALLEQGLVTALLPRLVAPEEAVKIKGIAGSFLPLRLVTYGVWCSAYFLLRHWILQRETEWRVARAEAAAAKAELELLRARVDPHFIFNVLNSILAVAGDANRVSMMIQALSRHLRFACDPARGTHALQDELRAVDNYIEIERFRFEDGLLFQADVDHDCLPLMVPAGCLMIPVENAVKHGAATSPPPLRVGVIVRRDGGQLQLTISNTGQWREAEPGHVGIGMTNLRNTLAKMFCEQLSLTVARSPGRVVVGIHMPVVPT